VTDVLDLHVWMRDALAAHPLFERVDGGELRDCPVLKAAMVSYLVVLRVKLMVWGWFLGVNRRF
jgi:hypothetical protein